MSHEPYVFACDYICNEMKVSLPGLFNFMKSIITEFTN